MHLIDGNFSYLVDESDRIDDLRGVGYPRSISESNDNLLQLDLSCSHVFI